MKTKAFTLAELLLTMTIIGVIASYTIPTLMQNIQDVHLKTSWKKAYSDFSQASNKLAMDYSGSLVNVFTSDDDVRNKILNYLTYIKKCDEDSALEPEGCWHAANNWYQLDKTPYGADYTGYSRVILTNGMLIAFVLRSASCTFASSPNNDTCAYFYIDVNGYKKPNMIGKDIFAGMILKEGRIIPRGTEGDSFKADLPGNSCDVNTYTHTDGWNCSADFLLNKNY